MSTGFTQEAHEQVASLLERLKSGFVDELDGFNGEPGSNTLQLFDVWRQISLRRIVDLADSAEAFFTQARLLPACTLTRAAVETVAVQYLVWKRLEALSSTSDSKGIHALLMSVVFGRRDKGEEWLNKSINVLTAIDHLDKRFSGFRAEYDRLSEYVHPGMTGGYGMYVRSEGEMLRSYFGQNPLGLKMGPWGQSGLGCALLVAVHFDQLLVKTRSKVQIVVKNSDASEGA